MANQILTLLVELDFQAQPVRLHSGVGTIAWNGGEWLGVGALGKISNVSESTDLQPARIKTGLVRCASGNHRYIVGRTLSRAARTHLAGPWLMRPPTAWVCLSCFSPG